MPCRRRSWSRSRSWLGSGRGATPHRVDARRRNPVRAWNDLPPRCDLALSRRRALRRRRLGGGRLPAWQRRGGGGGEPTRRALPDGDRRRLRLERAAGGGGGRRLGRLHARGGRPGAAPHGPARRARVLPRPAPRARAARLPLLPVPDVRGDLGLRTAPPALRRGVRVEPARDGRVGLFPGAGRRGRTLRRPLSASRHGGAVLHPRGGARRDVARAHRGRAARRPGRGDAPRADDDGGAGARPRAGGAAGRRHPVGLVLGSVVAVKAVAMALAICTMVFSAWRVEGRLEVAPLAFFGAAAAAAAWLGVRMYRSARPALGAGELTPLAARASRAGPRAR